MPRGRKPKPIVIIEEQNEYSDTLSQLPLSSEAGGDDDNGGDATTGSDSGASGDSGNRANPDSDSVVTGKRHGGNSRVGEIGGVSEVGAFGNENDALPSGVRPVAGGGANHRAGSRSRSRSDTDSANRAEENASPDNQPAPREVAYGSLGKGRGKKATATATVDTISLEFITEGIGLGMYGIGMLLNDVETWQVPQDDALEFATRLHKWINSGGGKKASALQKFIAKNEPLIGVGIGAATLVVPRILQTKRNRQRVNLQKAPVTATGGNGNGPANKSAASAPVVGQGISVDGVRNAANGRPVEPSTVNAHSFRREDFRATFGHDD